MEKKIKTVDCYNCKKSLPIEKVALTGAENEEMICSNCILHLYGPAHLEEMRDVYKIMKR